MGKNIKVFRTIFQSDDQHEKKVNRFVKENKDKYTNFSMQHITSENYYVTVINFDVKSK